MFRNKTIKLRNKAKLAHADVPWREVDWFHFSRCRASAAALYTPIGEGYSFRYVLYLRNGRRYTLSFFGNEIRNTVIQALAEQAPNATYEPYSRERYRQWKRDVQR